MIRMKASIVKSAGSSGRDCLDWICGSRWVGLAGLALALLMMTGCGGPPQIAKGNVKLVEKLRAAVASKKPDWLESTAKQIDEQRRAGNSQLWNTRRWNRSLPRRNTVTGTKPAGKCFAW